jgi:phage terminase small subunit
MKHPSPPSHLSKNAKKVWGDIVGCRPADFFSPGSLHLLEQFCVAVVQQRKYAVMMEDDHLDKGAVEQFVRLGALLNTTAQKLRLSIQSALRTDSGKNHERQNHDSASLLLGGEDLNRPN